MKKVLTRGSHIAQDGGHVGERLDAVDLYPVWPHIVALVPGLFSQDAAVVVSIRLFVHDEGYQFELGWFTIGKFLDFNVFIDRHLRGIWILISSSLDEQDVRKL